MKSPLWSVVDKAPTTVVTGENLGVQVRATTLYIPDLVQFSARLLDAPVQYLAPADVLLAIEVVSPDNPSNDQVLKRHAYAAAGIPEYWIVDGRDRTLTVLRPDGAGGYAVRGTARPSEPWHGDHPYPLTVDPAEIF